MALSEETERKEYEAHCKAELFDHIDRIDRNSIFNFFYKKLKAKEDEIRDNRKVIAEAHQKIGALNKLLEDSKF